MIWYYEKLYGLFTIWQLLKTLDNVWQLLTTFGHLWKPTTTCDSLWQLVMTCDNFWRLVTCLKLERYTRCWTKCQIWKSVTDRQKTEDRVTDDASTRKACASKKNYHTSSLFLAWNAAYLIPWYKGTRIFTPVCTGLLVIYL